MSPLQCNNATQAISDNTNGYDGSYLTKGVLYIQEQSKVGITKRQFTNTKITPNSVNNPYLGYLGILPQLGSYHGNSMMTFGVPYYPQLMFVCHYH